MAGAPLDPLARLGREAEVELRAGALAFAARNGDTGGLAALDGLTAGLGRDAGIEDLAAAVAGIALDEDAADQLPTVLARRAGPPMALALVWLEAARGLGWPAELLAFPGLALVRLSDGGGRRVIVDAGAGGAVMEPAGLRAALKAVEGMAAELRPALFSPLPNRDILIRQQDELKLRALLAGRIAQALALVEGLLAFAPDQVALWREAGMMNLRLDRTADAIAALEQFAARTANIAARRRTQQLLHDLRARLP